MSASLSWNDTTTTDVLAEILRNKFEKEDETPKLIADLVLSSLRSEKEWKDSKYVFLFAISGIGSSHLHQSLMLQLYIARAKRRKNVLNRDVSVVSNTEFYAPHTI